MAATWVGAAAAVLFVAATTRVGPSCSGSPRGHGVHAGDVVGAVVILVGAGLVTAWILRPQVVSPRVLVVGVVWLLAAVGVLAVATQTAVGPSCCRWVTTGACAPATCSPPGPCSAPPCSSPSASPSDLGAPDRGRDVGVMA